MTPAQARLDAALTAKREAKEKPGEPKCCIGCGKELRVATCWTERRGPGREGPYCFDCWGNA